jgi:hypothetical protein
MALRCQVVDLVRLHLLNDSYQAGRIRQVAVVKDEALVRFVWILIEMVDAVGIEQRRASLDTVDFVSFVEQQLGEIGAVLAGDACDQCNLHDQSFVLWPFLSGDASGMLAVGASCCCRRRYEQEPV